MATTLVWGAMLFAAGYLVVLGNLGHEKAKERLREVVALEAKLMAEHVRTRHLAAETVFSYARDRVALELQRSDAQRLDPGFVADLTRQVARYPMISSVWLSRPDGSTWGQWGKPLARSAPPTGVGSAQCTESYRAGKNFISITNCLLSGDGTSMGAVTVELATADVLSELMQHRMDRSGHTTRLAGPNGYLDHSFEAGVNSGGGMPPPLLNAIAAGTVAGEYETVDGANRRTLFTAFQRVEGSNLLAVVEVDATGALAGARALVGWAVFAAAMCLMCAVAVTMAILQNRALTRSRVGAERSASERKALIRKINSAVEDERSQIAVEIHDVLNAVLIRVRLDAQTIIALSRAGRPQDAIVQIAEKARAITEHANDLYNQARRIVRRLRPETLDVLGLEQAVDEMIKGYNAGQSSTHFTFSASHNLSEVDGDTGIAAYRLVQEALSNVIKHAGATEVSVSLAKDSARGVLTILVEDDGRGFDVDDVVPGIGVIGMRERVHSLNGSLRVSSSASAGTRIEAEIPL